MIRILFVTPGGAERLVEAQEDETLMQAAVRYQVEGIEAACGGAMSRRAPHAWVAEPSPALHDAERDMLDYGLHVRDGSHLTCQITLTPSLDSARIEVPPSQS